MAVIFRSKKGIFFTLIAMLIVTVFFVAFTPKSAVTLTERIPTVESRVATTNDFVELVRTAYLPAALRMSSYNALNALSEYEKEAGLRFAGQTDLNSRFAEVVLNGSMQCGGAHRDIETCICNADPGCADPSTLDFMKNRNFTQRQRDIVNLSLTQLQMWSNFSYSYSDYNVILYQNNDTGPFQVGVNATVNFSATNGIAWWNLTDTISVMFSIEGIEDPLYSVESRSQIGTLYTNVFNETNLTNWNLTQVFLEIEWRKYRYNPNGSSFLTRFTDNDEDSSCCGIESLINPELMAGMPAPDTTGSIEKVYADWCFFGNRCPPDDVGSLFNVSCISNNGAGDNKFRGFAVDATHAAMYNLTDYLYTAEPDPLAAQCNDIMNSVCNLDADVTCN